RAAAPDRRAQGRPRDDASGVRSRPSRGAARKHSRPGLSPGPVHRTSPLFDPYGDPAPGAGSGRIADAVRRARVVRAAPPRPLLVASAGTGWAAPPARARYVGRDDSRLQVSLPVLPNP